jgi:hypothetical protein
MDDNKQEKIFSVQDNVLHVNLPSWVLTCIKIGAIIGLIAGMAAGRIIISGM